MSHGVHAVQHEVEHQIEHEEHGKGGGHGGGHDSINKRIALVISVLALVLAGSETLGKSAQTSALNFQIEASNLWNFFQAKNIRRTAIIVATESAKIDLATAPDEARKTLIAKQIDEWNKTAARYRSEPEAAEGKGEGTVELARRAKEMEHDRDIALNKYHYFEFASAALQIGIVLCSAAVITGMIVLVWVAGGLGVLGLVFMSMALFFPHVHLLGGH
jgi:ABC-type nickel/cobalt efflux system permease component RcnA